MLDTPVAETAPEAEPTAKPAVEFHEPAGTREPLRTAVALPDVKRFSPKAIAVVGGVAAIVMIVAFSGLAKKPAAAKTAEASAQKAPQPGSAVAGLPPDYGSVASAMTGSGKEYLGPPGNGELSLGPDGRPVSTGVYGATGSGGSTQLSPLQQYWQQRELDRAKSADQARTASVSFAGGGEGGASATVSSATQALTNPLAQEAALLAAARTPPSFGTTASTAGRDDANRQDDKSAFEEKGRSSDFDLHHGVQVPASPYTMFAGTLIPCILTQGIDSDLPGQLGCLVSQNVYDTVSGKFLLLPQGTKAIGTYDSRVAYGQSRVLVVWTRLLRPDGSNISLEGMPGVDLSGYAGLTGKVNNHYVRLLTGVVLGSIIGAGAQIAAGSNNQNPSFAQLGVQGAGQNINQAGQQITRKNLDIQPTIEVAPGSRLNIVATKDLILPPYGS
jgi:type IV secretion system protein VirB10